MPSRTQFLGMILLGVGLVVGLSYLVTVVYPPLPVSQVELTVNILGQGITSPAEGLWKENSDSNVSVLATPTSGWGFSNWELNGSNSTTNPITFTVNANTTLTAVFKANPKPS